MTDTIIVSETFFSAQGEGPYCNRPSVWIRFFNCNLQCDGFSQKDPTDPSTYELPYKTIDISKITKLEELPVFHKGCDSSYSWSAKFKHLQHKYTMDEFIQKIYAYIPGGDWIHPKTHTDTHLVFTGGEPLLPKNQKQVLAILLRMENDRKLPWFITFETNGTQKLTPDLKNFFIKHQQIEVLFSVSPKLFSVSGEIEGRAIIPAAVQTYENQEFDYRIIYKFVVNGKDQAWSEMEDAIRKLNEPLEYTIPEIYVMPLGATVEEQTENTYGLTAGQIANEALARGYNISPRVHVALWGNTMGV